MKGLHFLTQKEIKIVDKSAHWISDNLSFFVPILFWVD